MVERSKEQSSTTCRHRGMRLEPLSSISMMLVRLTAALATSVLVLLAAVSCVSSSTEPPSSSSTTTNVVLPTTTVPVTPPPSQMKPDESSTTSTVLLTEQSEIIYFVFGEKLVATRRTVQMGDNLKQVVESLLAGPNALESEIGFGTAIPSGTRLRAVRLVGGTAQVDLSADYGSGGGSLSMLLRVAQVVFTLTELPGVERVEFLIEGSPVDSIGGEGVAVAGGVTRADFQEFLPSVLLLAPCPGQKVSGIVEVKGHVGPEVNSVTVILTGRDGLILEESKPVFKPGDDGRRWFEATFSVAGPATRGAIILKWTNSTGERESFEIPVEILG